MELQIGLPFLTHEDPFKPFDQMKNTEQKMEKTNCYMGRDNGCFNNKRSYEQAFGEINKTSSSSSSSSSSSCNSLPLLLWAGQPNDEDDRERKKLSTTTNRSNMEEKGYHQVVGWPPIKSWRRKTLYQNQGGYILANNRGGGDQGTSARESLIYPRQRWRLENFNS